VGSDNGGGAGGGVPGCGLLLPDTEADSERVIERGRQRLGAGLRHMHLKGIGAWCLFITPRCYASPQLASQKAPEGRQK
jgi:hypothetical protein